MNSTRYWLMKSEPTSYSIDDLARDQKTHWSGVRNYQARNFMRDDMRVGDGVLFYHSNATPSGVTGIARVSKAGYPDFTAWDPKDPHYDPKSPSEKPLWVMIDIQFVEKFPDIVSLEAIKREPRLTGIAVAQKGSRLSVQPVSSAHFNLIRQMGEKRKAESR